MRIAILSDIHDNVWKLEIALRSIQNNDMLICCGDLCSPFILDQLARGFAGPTHIVFGNNDADTFRITAKASKYSHVHLRGEFFEMTVDDRLIAVNHFDNIALAIAAGGQYDAVFYGHNHVFDIRTVGRKTLAVNPGSIMGCQFDAHANRTDVVSTFAVYDTTGNAAQGYRIESNGEVHAVPMKTQIGMLLFPRLTQLDLTGPFEVFHRISNTEVHLVWKNLDPVRADSGMSILPTTTLAKCPILDVLFVPGGPGQVELMADEEILVWLAAQAAEAQWVTSVCTGSLLLGAAGLLKGYRAGCHWMSRDQLSLLHAIPASERVVVDRNRITGAGVTAGIDFALHLTELLRDETEARSIALQLEYDPAPPFGPGSPENNELDLIIAQQRKAKPMLAARRAATEKAGGRLVKP